MGKIFVEREITSENTYEAENESTKITSASPLHKRTGRHKQVLRCDQLSEFQGEADKERCAGCLGGDSGIVLESKVVVHKEGRRVPMRKVGPVIPPLGQPAGASLLTVECMSTESLVQRLTLLRVLEVLCCLHGALVLLICGQWPHRFNVSCKGLVQRRDWQGWQLVLSLVHDRAIVCFREAAAG